MLQPLPDRLTRSPLPGLGDTFASRVARNFFTHSGHVPLTLLILELLLAPSVGGYFIEPDPYLLLLAGIGQALVIGYAERREIAAKGKSEPLAACVLARSA